MKYSPTAAALPQPPGSRNQESRYIRLSVLKAAVLVPPQGSDSHRKHQWGRYFQAKLEEPPTTQMDLCEFKASLAYGPWPPPIPPPFSELTRNSRGSYDDRSTDKR
ncbi:hypothetical protein STEG23_029443 [Scotinomys teguina]